MLEAVCDLGYAASKHWNPESLTMIAPKPDIVYDESGKLLSGVFFEFAVQFSDDVDDEDRDASWIVIPREPPAAKLTGTSKDRWMRIQELYDVEYSYNNDCSVSQSHQSNCFLKSKEVGAGITGGRRLSEFIPVSLEGELIVHEDFARRLKKTNLTGLNFVPVKVVENQSGGPDPILFVLDFRGQLYERPRRLLHGTNACPFCGLKPLICPECGVEEHPCSRCDELTLVFSEYHEGPKDDRLTIAPVPKEGRIYQGNSWDGKDFCGKSNVITKRALDWLLTVHAAPFYVRPARVLVDGMSKTQLEQLKKAQQPLDDM